MGRDEFLKLLVAQLKNQDPLKPQDNSQFVAELAQFSSLEQSMGINDRLDLLTTQSRGQSNAQVLTMVGQLATVKGSVVSTDGNGGTASIGFTLGGNATSTTVTISNSDGKVVRTLETGAKNAGYVRVTWDGKDLAGNLQPKGSYSVSVKAKNSQDAAVPTDQQTIGIVKGISFDQGYPVLQLDNGASAPVSDLLRVDSPPTGP
jgi:flagellar basal-body rod modification protein FlgD